MKLKKHICSLLCFALTLSVTTAVCGAHESAENEPVNAKINGIDYIQTFNDDFNGTTLDNTKWVRCPEWSRQNNFCVWDDDMTKLDGNGNLILQAAYDDQNILRCGAVRTRDLFYQKYGYFEIKVKLQQKSGFWSAFWMMPDKIDTGVVGGSDGTEIDIFEAFSPTKSKINHAIHFDGYGSNHKSVGTAVTSDVYDGQYHLFALDWSENEYNFYIDGKKTYTITSDMADISKIENYMKISLESGSWTGLPNEEDVPDGIAVDYVKAYQRADNLPPVFGDVNRDGVIGAKDVLITRKYLAGFADTGIVIRNANVNSDDVVNAKDLLALRKHMAGFHVEPWN